MSQRTSGTKWCLIKEISRANSNRRYFLCKCVCGVISEVRGLKDGLSSQACHRCSNGKRKHSLSNSPIYNRWCAMKQRCYYKKSNSAKNYGDRGITVCKEWKESFQNFYDWSVKNGFKEELTLDRIDNNKGYSPKNCRWVPQGIQNKNQRSNINVTIAGRTQILRDWCRELNINYDSVRHRIYSGKTPIEALKKTTGKFKERNEK